MSGMNDKLIKAMAELDEKAVLKVVKEELSRGVEPLSILKQIQSGIEKVGELYEKGEYFIADLIMSGIIFNNVLKIEEMNLYTTESKNNRIGKVLLGTAKSDLHDIGKNVFGNMMKMAGFEVLDLGVDVAPETFVARIEEYRPQIVGISGVLIVALEGMKETVELITAAGLRDSVKIILGGTIVKNGVDFIGADAYTVDPSEGVKLCLDWFEA